MIVEGESKDVFYLHFASYGNKCIAFYTDNIIIITVDELVIVASNAVDIIPIQ